MAFVLQVGSAFGTSLADSYLALYLSALAAGLGHGIVEAVINPVCAAVYPKEKTKWLTILHAAWPAGLVLGTLLIIGGDSFVEGGMTWRAHALWILIPAVPYLLMYLPCKFPTDERVQAGVPYIEMLRQVGFLTAFLASALMTPVATAELGTDGWIKGLMTPVLDGHNINPALALAFSALIMLVLRVFVGNVLKHFSPPRAPVRQRHLLRGRTVLAVQRHRRRGVRSLRPLRFGSVVLLAVRAGLHV